MKATQARPRVTPYRLTAYEPSEAAVLAAILSLLALDRRVAWFERMNSGAFAVGDGRARRFVKFGFKGCPDILGQLKGGRLLAIEVKSRTGRLSSDQVAFLDKAVANGAVAGVARSVDDVQALMIHVKPEAP